ncbi:hypothetical protein D9M71_452450 [compost metagenome]
MHNLFWRLLAKLLARPDIADWLIERARRTPYQNIWSPDGSKLYMARWWLLNPYDRNSHKPKYWWFPWSIRIHHILRPDDDRDLHDHPWDARTVILRGWYAEQRLADEQLTSLLKAPSGAQVTEFIDRRAGDTATLNHGEYHRIDQVSPGGVFTMFITSRWQGEWGFLVDGEKVHWKKYTGEQQ